LIKKKDTRTMSGRCVKAARKRNNFSMLNDGQIRGLLIQTPKKKKPVKDVRRPNRSKSSQGTNIIKMADFISVRTA
jgi:hypothetical protein